MCCRGSISIPGRKQGVRHMIALSEELRGLKSLSRTYVLRPEPNEVWSALVHRFGLPGAAGLGRRHVPDAEGERAHHAGGQHRVLGSRNLSYQ